jgi:excisionase family DNA binding protein
MFQKILYSKKEAAAVLALSPQMLMLLVKRGELAATRVGTRVLFSADELHRFVRAHTKPHKDLYEG